MSNSIDYFALFLSLMEVEIYRLVLLFCLFFCSFPAQCYACEIHFLLLQVVIVFIHSHCCVEKEMCAVGSGDFCPQVTFGDIWRPFRLSQLDEGMVGRQGMLLAFRGRGQGGPP